MPDGIGGITAIAEDRIPSGIAVNRLILAKSGEQAAERANGDIELANGRGQCDKNGMRRRTGVTEVQFILPGIEEEEGA